MKFDKEQHEERLSAIAWMARNKVAPTMLMLLFLIGGVLISSQMNQRVLPDIAPDIVTVQIQYPGGNPAEVEDGVLLSLEDGLRGVDGIKSISTSAFDEVASASVTIQPFANSFKVFQDIKNAIDRIVTFSSEAERPVVQLEHKEPPLMSIMVYGNQEDKAIRSLAERVQDELASLPDIGNVQLATTPIYEMAIEIPVMMLRQYGLTLDQVAYVIQDSTRNLPAGEIYAKEGKILLQSLGIKDSENEYAQIPITTTPDGTVVKLGDIATIQDDFRQSDNLTRYNNFPATSIDVFQNGKKFPRAVSEAVKKYIQNLEPELPNDTHIEIWKDSSQLFHKRLSIIIVNGIVGFVLVTMLLGAFFEIRLALWVAFSIPVVLFGSFFLIPFANVSINMLSIYTFLVVIGIVIDNSVVTGESVYKKREDAMDNLEASQVGAQDVALSILFGSVVSSLGFLPMLFIPGENGKYFTEIPIIAISIFIVSVISSLFILPSQLAGKPIQHPVFDLLNRPKILMEESLKSFIAKVYIPIVHVIIAFRFRILVCAIVLLATSGIIVREGILPYSPFPVLPPDEISIKADFSQSILEDDRAEVSNEIMKVVDQLLQDRNINMVNAVLHTSTANSIEIKLKLVEPQKRSMTAQKFAQILRSSIADPIGATSFSISFAGAGARLPSFEVDLSHRSGKMLDAAAKDLVRILGSYHGIIGTENETAKGKRQFDFELLPAARSIGITSGELGRQIRAAFYGTEAMRRQRGRDQVRIMVRLPRSERSSLETLSKLIIRSPDGQEMFLSQAAAIKETISASTLQRVNGRRHVKISAEFSDDSSSVHEVSQVLMSDELPRLLQRYPGLTYTLSGEQIEEEEATNFLVVGFLFVILFIYTLLAILFKSYIQPIVVIAVIPFEIIGPIAGHLYMGYPLSIISLFGVVALTGIVVNAASMMLVTANNMISSGYSPLASIRLALIYRFRAVMLTAVGTILVAVPFLSESAPEGRAFFPLMISLGVGALFSIFISLGLVPALFLISFDVKSSLQTVITGIKIRVAKKTEHA